MTTTITMITMSRMNTVITMTIMITVINDHNKNEDHVDLPQEKESAPPTESPSSLLTRILLASTRAGRG